MQDFNNDDVKKMLEMLKEQAEIKKEDKIHTQTTNDMPHSDDDIKDMLKKHFSAEDGVEVTPVSEDYSFDTVDFGIVDDETITGEIKVQESAPSKVIVEDERVGESSEDDVIVEEIVEEEVIEEEITEEDIIEDEAQEEIEEEITEDVVAEEEVIEKAQIDNTAIVVEQIVEEVIDESQVEVDKIIEEAIEETIEESIDDIEEAIEEIAEETEEIKEEPVEPEESVSREADINYDEVLEGQQGTVFNNFVEDFSGDLEDVVFEAEITESRAPDKQYTIFEDWERLMRDKQYATAEEGIIPPTKEELERSAEIARNAQGNTDYFSPVIPDKELDAVDIALMAALSGDDQTDQTVGFEKIRQAVHSEDDEKKNPLENQSIYGCYGEEYSSLAQNGKIRDKFKSDKIKLILQTVGTALIFVFMLIYEIAGWTGYEFSDLLSISQNVEIHVLFGLQLLFFCALISCNKIIKLFKSSFTFSSITYICAFVALGLSIIHDIFILWLGYAGGGETIHSVSALLFLASLVCDVFDIIIENNVFNVVASSEKKLVLEPYGKLRIGEDENTGDIIDKDSYCISRVSNVSKLFERTARPSSNITSKIVPLILSFSVALSVMLVLLAINKSVETMLLGFVITLAFTLVCSCVFESEFAFFFANLTLKKHKTGIIGKSSVAEYGRCNIVYFDDFNVFSNKSVRTKGLKLYDNNEIYRILYHTQAVFSKVGGPLKGVFEFATTEMVHSKSVDIKEISKEGIVAVVDNRTSVLIGTGAFMRNRGIHPSYTAADLKLEEIGEESIMFIALNGVLGAKLYVTYQFAGEFERLARKLSVCGIEIGIRSSDPNINNKWAKKYGETKKLNISIVRPSIKEMNAPEKIIDCGIVSTKNVRALAEALMTCVKLDSLELLLSKVRIAAIVLTGILSFALVSFAGVNMLTILVLTLTNALCATVMLLLTHFYIRK